MNSSYIEAYVITIQYIVLNIIVNNCKKSKIFLITLNLKTKNVSFQFDDSLSYCMNKYNFAHHTYYDNDMNGWEK